MRPCDCVCARVHRVRSRAFRVRALVACACARVLSRALACTCTCTLALAWDRHACCVRACGRACARLRAWRAASGQVRLGLFAVGRACGRACARGSVPGAPPPGRCASTYSSPGRLPGKVLLFALLLRWLSPRAGSPPEASRLWPGQKLRLRAVDERHPKLQFRLPTCICRCRAAWARSFVASGGYRPQCRGCGASPTHARRGMALPALQTRAGFYFGRRVAST